MTEFLNRHQSRSATEEEQKKTVQKFLNREVQVQKPEGRP